MSFECCGDLGSACYPKLLRTTQNSQLRTQNDKDPSTLDHVRSLGIDYGRRRIGLALSDPSGTLARPWKVIQIRGNLDHVVALLADEVARLRAEGDGLATIVLGWPRKLSGEPTDQTSVVEALAPALERRTGVPVALQDERLTSREAESRLAIRVKDWRQRKPLLDAASAAVILQDYLDGRARGGPGPQEGAAPENLDE